MTAEGRTTGGHAGPHLRRQKKLTALRFRYPRKLRSVLSFFLPVSNPLTLGFKTVFLREDVGATLAVARFFWFPATSNIWAVGDAGPYKAQP